MEWSVSHELQLKGHENNEDDQDDCPPRLHKGGISLKGLGGRSPLRVRVRVGSRSRYGGSPVQGFDLIRTYTARSVAALRKESRQAMTIEEKNSKDV